MKYKHITIRERYKIEGYLEAGMSRKRIAELIHKDYSTICREIKRGMVKQILKEYHEVYVYRADYAQLMYEEKEQNKGRKSKLLKNPELVSYLEKQIKRGYSPEVALFTLKQENPSMCKVCFKTVYNALDRHEFPNITYKDLLYKKETIVPKEPQAKAVDIKRRSIEERPQIINNRFEFGHWEMDCVLSGQCTTSQAALLVLTERLTRASFTFKMPDKTQESVKEKLDQLEKALKGDFHKLIKSITMDNGTEFINQSLIEQSCLNNGLRTTAYYCHAYSAFERGSNENYNRFIRRFVPKGATIDSYSDKEIYRIMQFINNYPRRMLDFQSSICCLKKYTDNPIFLTLIGNNCCN